LVFAADAIFGPMQFRLPASVALALSLAGAPLLAQASPAHVAGLWCGAGLLHEFSLEIAQREQSVTGRLVRKDKIREITGRVEGDRLHTDTHRDHSMDLQVDGDALRITGATGVLALATGQFFTRAPGATCTS
jgi:hypothetical protein